MPKGLSYNSLSRKTIDDVGGMISNLAVGFRTGYGDGEYPVYARINDEDRVMSLMIDSNRIAHKG